jgi:hypothetical protein
LAIVVRKKLVGDVGGCATGGFSSSWRDNRRLRRARRDYYNTNSWTIDYFGAKVAVLG